MGKNCIRLDLAQLEIVNHLTAWKAGVLLKAIVGYATTGEVAPWGEDQDLKPIFLSFRASMEEQREEDKVQQGKEKRAERNRRYYLRRFKTIKTIKTSYQESERERDGDEEKRSKREEEKEKAKGKEKCVRAPQFVPPTLAQVKEYVKENGLKMDAEHFYDHFTSNGWKVSGKATMKDWQAAVRNWARNETKYDKQRTAHGTSVGERAYNMLHFSAEGHPEVWEEEERIIKELQKYQ